MTAIYTIDDIIGISRNIASLKTLVQKTAPTDANILITGESGTGKELIAQAVHNHSPRNGKPFIAINCGAIPRGLIESELFGFVKGSFTGAVADSKGKLSLAHKGSLFLDEIGEMPFDLQAKLLRVIEGKAFYPVGGKKRLSSDFRLICATNRNLEAMCSRGEFREDLYYRINTIRISIPPLRDRTEDIPLLCRFFLDKYCKKLGRDKSIGISEQVLKAYTDYSWPGNVRELENLLEREAIFAGKEEIHVKHIAQQVRKVRRKKRHLPTVNLKELEGIALTQAMGCFATRDEMAEAMGISRSSLFRKLKEHGIIS